MAFEMFPVDVTTVTFFSRIGLAIVPLGRVTTFGVTVLMMVGAPETAPAAPVTGRWVMITVRGGPPCAGTNWAC